MKLPSFSPWWLCLLALPIASFLILGSPQERSPSSPSVGIVQSEPAPASALSTVPAYMATMSEPPPPANTMRHEVSKSDEGAGTTEATSPQPLSLEIGPDQAVPAAVASFAKDFTPKDISVAQQLRQAFYDTVATLSPKDPDFTAKWNAAQKENDELYRLYYGKDRYLAQHRKAYMESFADGNQQPEH